MSELITTDAERQGRLKEIIKRLHAGAPASEVKKDFASLIKGTSAEEVAAMEQALVDEGFPPEEIQRLCEVHVAVFESSLERGAPPKRVPGHPVHTFMAENQEAARLTRRLLLTSWAWTLGANRSAEAREALEALSGLTLHYARKENQLFPYLERKGFTAPTKVMWGKDDEIRDLLRGAREALATASGRAGARAFLSAARPLAQAIRRMIFMEERILFPNALRRLSERDWAEIRSGEGAIGYAWVRPGAEYDAGIVLSRGREASSTDAAAEAPRGLGAAYSPREPEGTGAAPGAPSPMRGLPLDVSVVGSDDRVLYYSDSPERIFPCSPAIIGRDVRNCHPSKSVAVVERILDSFKRGERDSARFWLEMGGRFVVIEYRALRDAEGRYLGTIEVSQDVTGIRALEGQRRLLDWE
jgi:DUF438 domain-containing protein